MRWPTGFGERRSPVAPELSDREGQIVRVLEEATRRHPRVTVGSYPRFLDDGPEVDVVLKSSDADALGEASAWVEAALDASLARLQNLDDPEARLDPDRLEELDPFGYGHRSQVLVERHSLPDRDDLRDTVLVEERGEADALGARVSSLAHQVGQALRLLTVDVRLEQGGDHGQCTWLTITPVMIRPTPRNCCQPRDSPRNGAERTATSAG